MSTSPFEQRPGLAPPGVDIDADAVAVALTRKHARTSVLGLHTAGFTLWLAKRLARVEEAWRAARGFGAVSPELPRGPGRPVIGAPPSVSTPDTA